MWLVCKFLTFECCLLPVVVTRAIMTHNRYCTTYVTVCNGGGRTLSAGFIHLDLER